MDQPSKNGHAPGPHPSEFNLKEYLRIISSRRWWLISIVAVVVSATAIYNYKLPDIFQATSKVQINKETPNIVDVKEVVALQSQASEFLKTQYKILGSRSIAERVIKKLDLTKHPEFNGQDVPKGLLTRAIELFSPPPTVNSSARMDYVGIYYQYVSISPEPLTLLVDVSVTLKDREMVAKVANAHAEAYVAQILDERLGATSGAAEWLEHQSAELQAKLDKSEAALQKYREDNKLVSLEDKQNIVVEKLKQLNDQVNIAQNVRITAENSYTQLKAMKEKGGDPTTLPVVLQDPVVQDLKKQLSEKSSLVSKLEERYGELHPDLKAAKSERDEKLRNLKQQVEKLQAAIETDYQLAVSREKNLQAALKDQEQVAMSLNERQIGYEALKRQAEADRKMWDEVNARMKQTNVTKQLDSTNVSIMDYAVEPFGLFRPRRMLNIGISFFLAVVFGCGFCVVIESLTETVREPEDLTREFHMPFLGYIPHRPKAIFCRQSPIANNGHNATAEAFRTALAVLSLQPESANAQCFVVTSATPSEGKTTCAINLAASFADRNFKTLLIEADLRRPNIGRNLGLATTGGLERLGNGSAPSEELIQVSSHPNLSAVVCGTPPANAHGLLALPSIHEFVATMRQQYDRIVIDTPPIGAVSDALSMCALADGVVWVVRFDTARRKVIRDAFHRLVQVKAKVLGFIINDVNLSSRHNKYYYSYHGYDSYYGKRG